MRVSPLSRLPSARSAWLGLRGLGALTLLAALAACGTDDVGPTSRMVGGRCTSARDCVQRCLTESQFPGGYCAVDCTADRDCPGGSTCVATGGGVCLATCHVNADCKGFGSAYTCTAVTNQSGSTGARACVGS